MKNLIRYANNETTASGFNTLDVFGNNSYTTSTKYDANYKMGDSLVVMYETEKGANVVTFNEIIGIAYVGKDDEGRKTYTYNLSEYKCMSTNNNWSTVTQNLDGNNRSSIMRGDLNRLVF